MGRSRHRRSTARLPARPGVQRHALPHRCHSYNHNAGGHREAGRVKLDSSRRRYTRFNREGGAPPRPDEGNNLVMTLVEIEGNRINTDQVCVVRPADQDGSGFQTEIVMAAGLQKLKMPVAEAAKAL